MARYRDAIAWIGVNDETAERDPRELVDLISVTLVADVWSTEPMQVAIDVVNYRVRNERYLREKT